MGFGLKPGGRGLKQGNWKPTEADTSFTALGIDADEDGRQESNRFSAARSRRQVMEEAGWRVLDGNGNASGFHGRGAHNFAFASADPQPLARADMEESRPAPWTDRDHALADMRAAMRKGDLDGVFRSLLALQRKRGAAALN